MFDEDRLEVVAGQAVFGRGVEYTRYVRGMRVVGTTATATIQARNVYQVELNWPDQAIDGSCTCPHFADGFFCKHLVALGLCVIDDTTPQHGSTANPPPAVVELVAELDIEELRDTLAEMATRDESVRRQLEFRHAAATGSTDHFADDLMSLVRDRLAARGFIDYRRSFEFARDAEQVLDELQRCLDARMPDAARPALLKSLTRLRSISTQADDSSGVIGEACQRAADLYAQACRQGNPDPVKLARWLVKFRNDSPGWPEVTLADFVAAFDDAALATYRSAVHELDDDDHDADHRFETDRMLLELADHDGDVDRAVQLLSRGRSPRYGEIVTRLQDAGRAEEALAWIDQAVNAGRLSPRGSNEYWLDPMEVATTYRHVGRVDDALDVLSSAFAQSPGTSTFRHLVDFAAQVNRGDEMRGWALTKAREQASHPHSNGAALIEIALAESDLDAAWEAAERFGAGHQWQKLAEASAHVRPLGAAGLYRHGIDTDLAAGPNTKLYPGIARRLAIMKDLHTAGGRPEDFAAYLASIRNTYARRPSLMKALDAQGL